MRLIDADKLTPLWMNNEDGLPITGAVLIDDILNAPTIDAIRIVRCKDCRFYLQSNEKCELVDTRLRFYETDKTWTGDCFCSWGERKHEDETD